MHQQIGRHPAQQQNGAPPGPPRPTAAAGQAGGGGTMPPPYRSPPNPLPGHPQGPPGPPPGQPMKNAGHGGGGGPYNAFNVRERFTYDVCKNMHQILELLPLPQNEFIERAS